MTPLREAGLALIGLGAVGLAAFAIASRASGSPSGPPPGPACVPLQLEAQGPGTVSGCGASTRSSTQVCPQPGESCVYTAWPDGGAGFSQWEGPDGMVSTDNPVTIPAWGAGFVRGVFVPLTPSPPQRVPCPTWLGAIVTSDAPGNTKQYVIDACVRKHWIDSGFQFAACFYDPLSVTPCNVDVIPEGPAVSALNCCPGTGDGQCRGC